MFYLSLLPVLAVAAFVVFLLWGTHWGSTKQERARRMPGDAYFEGCRRRKVKFTRAVSIQAGPDTVWPWLAQLGRGAGWYSVDWLDNGGKESARHIISWIPEPRVGDASAIGYLRDLEVGRALVWWVNGVRFFGALARLVTDIQITEDDDRTRLVIRMSADAEGPMAWPALILFRFIDSIMAVSQIRGIRERVERFGARSENPDNPESGSRDQYQLYEVIYASGERAGVPGKESADRWRGTAIKDGVLTG